MKKMALTLIMVIGMTIHASEKQAVQPLFDMAEMRDPATLDIEVLQDWHQVDGEVKTRQKLVTIRVGELWPGQDFRIPVRMVVPVDQKAKGFHLTGSYTLKKIKDDAQVEGVNLDLVRGGVGLVYTIVQEPKRYGQGELAEAMAERFIKTLEPRYSIQYWAWPATLMRAATTAYAETDYFEKGKIALTGGSKNGASPSVALIADDRMTAQHAMVSPIWESPLRLCDEIAWDELNAFEAQKPQENKHRFLGGNFGPIYNDAALTAGHSWQNLQQFAHRMAGHIFISQNLEALEKRGVDFFFQPGTHDFVAYDVPWGSTRYPQIPTYLKVNSGHGHKAMPASAETDEKNKQAFLLHHFFGDMEPMLESPTATYKKSDGKLLLTVQFPKGSQAETGRVWWMFDRGLDGSHAYIQELFPDDQWNDMTYDATKDAWTTEIELRPGASHIDFFSNHRKTVHYKSKSYATYISCPYTRVSLQKGQ